MSWVEVADGQMSSNALAKDAKKKNEIFTFASINSSHAESSDYFEQTDPPTSLIDERRNSWWNWNQQFLFDTIYNWPPSHLIIFLVNLMSVSTTSSWKYYWHCKVTSYTMLWKLWKFMWYIISHIQQRRVLCQLPCTGIYLLSSKSNLLNQWFHQVSESFGVDMWCEILRHRIR